MDRDFSQDDVRASVSAGIINEAQAASIITLAQQRRGARDYMNAREEPFELFRGFNEIFIVVGLVILYGGWSGLTGLSIVFGGPSQGFVNTIIFGLIAAGVMLVLAEYFTVRRRMVAPSIVIMLMFTHSIARTGLGVSWMLNADTAEQLTLAAGLSTVALFGFYLRYRVPSAIAIMALGVFATCFGFITIGGTFPDNPADFFLLTDDGPFAILTFVLGVVGFLIAMWFDMGDPHRVSLRSRSGFWLHVVSAPAIVNTVALTLFTQQSPTAYVAVFGFVSALAVVAVAIDRRSFLVSGVGYIVALAFTVLDGSGFWAILLLGLGLILLGAKWEALRGWLMASLPAFPGKDRLPPWGLEEISSGEPPQAVR